MTETDDRLSQIPTLWSVVQRAHGDGDARAAQERLLSTYSGAIRRYLLAALRSPEAADDVFQEFALRFVRGDFRNANPERGRFRNFLKTCLYNLIVDHQRRQKRNAHAVMESEQVVAPVDPAPDAHADAAFVASWREDLLARAWQSLENDERTTGKPYHTVLQLRAKQPDLSSTQLAAAATDQLQREITPANIRVIVHRARELFAECLLQAVIDSLPENRRDLIEEELIELQLLEYCRAALEK